VIGNVANIFYLKDQALLQILLDGLELSFLLFALRGHCGGSALNRNS
jgi:hypothetical protein